MSYRCKASFKIIPNDIYTLYDFFSQLKTYATQLEVAEYIIKDNKYYCPLMRMDMSSMTKSDAYYLPELEYWIIRMFTFKWKLIQYENEYVLCMLGVPDKMQELFDGSVYFQNSTDQDYELDEWPLAIFKNIYNRWQREPIENVAKYLYGEDKLEEDDDEAYHRRVATYKEIATPVEDLLYDDRLTHYVQLLSANENAWVLHKYKKYCIQIISEEENESDKNNS